MISMNIHEKTTIRTGEALHKILMSYTDKKLYEVRRQFEISGGGIQGKAKLVSLLEGGIRDIFQKRIYYLDYERYCILRHISDNGEINESFADKDLYAFMNIGMVFEYGETGSEIIVVPGDLIDIFKEHDGKALEVNARENSELFVLINGCLNSYGLIDYASLFKIVGSHSDIRIDDNRFRRALKECEALHGMILPEDDFVYSRSFDNPSYFVDEQAKFKELGYKEFTREQLVINADLLIKPSSHCSLRLLRLLRKHFKANDEKLGMAVSVLIWNARCCREAEESLAFIIHELGKITGGFLNEFMPLYAAYNNETGKFALKGHTPGEVMKIQYPQLHENLVDINAYGSGNGKVIPFERGIRTGRNEPCPCGSGKKHKFCCGK
ncbi:MAG: SEC-C domain-containing protein [Clostridia bacterium]|nr:SEC-C domain-containing protein [Clostridia bacterium]